MPDAQSALKAVSGYEMRRNSKRPYPLVMMLKKNWIKSVNVLQRGSWDSGSIEMVDNIFDTSLFVSFEVTKINVNKKRKKI